MIRKVCLVLALAVSLAAGGWWFLHKGGGGPAPDVSFYHWKTVYSPGSAAEEMLRLLKTPRLYVRFFDVKVEDGRPVPVATAIFSQTPTLPVVPVVFVDEELMRFRAGGPEWLAPRIVNRVNEMIAQNKLTPAKELQLDCDWTAGSRESFFGLVREVKKTVPAGWTVSVTLRLSQYRDFAETGVPPADRAALMLYNMGQLRAFGDHNSILDAAVAANYLKPVSYPLPLDVALPLFSWGVVFDRDKNYRGLARELPPNLNDPAAFERVSPIMYKALKPARWNGNGMYAGEYLRVERTEPAELDKLVKQAGQALGTVKTVIFYHLDEAVLAPYSKDALQNAADALR